MTTSQTRETPNIQILLIEDDTVLGAALSGSIQITVAEPLEHCASVAHDIQIRLGLPLVFVIPFAPLAIALAVRASLGHIRRFLESLSARNAADLSSVPTAGLTPKIEPMAAKARSCVVPSNPAPQP